MEYRKMGKTGLKTSIIGLGCEHLDGGKPYAQIKETVDAALEGGVNIFDMFMPGKEIREAVAKALGDRRKDVIIQGHIGSTDVKQQYDISRDLPTAQRYFEELLRIFGGHIELGMMFFIDSDKDYEDVFETGFADYVQRLKKQGDIGNIGFSSHNPKTAVKAINTGLPEMLMFSVNPAFDMLPVDEYTLEHLEKDFGKDMFKGIDPDRAALYALCDRKQIGITVMKTFGAGKLLSAEYSPFSEPLSVGQCVHYALSRPGVCSVLPGCKTAAEMRDVLKYLMLDEKEKDYSKVLSAARNDFRGKCLYCSHCQPCPANIDIAAVNKYLDVAMLNTREIPQSIKAQYGELPYKGDSCVKCGHCESRCPFGVPVMENMDRSSILS
ncbi:MAG: aldo/keto reductase [Oscillospiraceae bacterium]|nr:aldo/keto reductase [Oscillospiraceae bacterium]